MKTLTIALPDEDFEFYQYAWNELADAVLTADERGQRGAGRSVLFRMICTVSITNFDDTVRLLKEIKKLTKHGG